MRLCLPTGSTPAPAYERFATSDGPMAAATILLLDEFVLPVGSPGRCDAMLERDLLALLASDPGAVRTRDEILESVWDPHWYGPTKTLDVHIASLRRKLGDPGLVETVRGVGFRLRDAP